MLIAFEFKENIKAIYKNIIKTWSTCFCFEYILSNIHRMINNDWLIQYRVSKNYQTLTQSDIKGEVQ